MSTPGRYPKWLRRRAEKIEVDAPLERPKEVSLSGMAGRNIELSNKESAFLEAMRGVPRGSIVTYGQIAELAGYPGRARAVATLLRHLGRDVNIPWHRILGKKNARFAYVAIRDFELAQKQMRLVMSEGVVVNNSGWVSLRDFGWLPTG